MHFDDLDIVHVVGVTVQVEFSQPVVRARVVEEADRAHFIPDYDFIFAETSDGSDFVFTAIRIIYFLSVGTDPESFLLPLDSHFHKDGVDSSIVLIGIQVDHGYFFISVLKQKVFVIDTKIDVV